MELLLREDCLRELLDSPAFREAVVALLATRLADAVEGRSDRSWRGDEGPGWGEGVADAAVAYRDKVWSVSAVWVVTSA